MLAQFTLQPLRRGQTQEGLGGGVPGGRAAGQANQGLWDRVGLWVGWAMGFCNIDWSEFGVNG